MTPYEQCLAFYRRWMADYHMSVAQIDETELDLLLDIEIVDSKIDAASEQQRDKKGQKKSSRKVFIDQLSWL